MTTYIIVCVILFGIDAFCKMIILGFGAESVAKWSRAGLFFDTTLALGMCGWGLVLLFK